MAEATHVVTLISDPARPCLGPAEIAGLRAVIDASDPRVLADGFAVDLPFSGTDPAAADARLREHSTLPVDIVVQPAAGRRKRLFLADMDSTMIGQECIDELADLVGLKAGVAAITERAMRGEIAFEPALRERVALLKGLPVEVVDELLRSHITLMPGGRALVATMRAHGAYACLVSGGFTAFTGPVAERLGFDENRGNVLLVEGDRFTGFVAEPILGREAKRETLVELRNRLGLSQADVLAVGDGANDLAMLGEAGLGVAFRAKPAVAAAAGARIEHGDLTALLYLQGFRREEFRD